MGNTPKQNRRARFADQVDEMFGKGEETISGAELRKVNRKVDARKSKPKSKPAAPARLAVGQRVAFTAEHCAVKGMGAERLAGEVAALVPFTPIQEKYGLSPKVFVRWDGTGVATSELEKHLEPTA